MLTQLSTVKARLGIDDFEVKYDALLTNAIRAYSTQFDKVCHRAFARTVDATEEFDGDETEIIVASYPIEAVTKFELKSNETEGWVEQTGVEYLLRRNCRSEEFDGDETEIIVASYPIEAVTKFELKSNETEGWVEQTGVEYLLRRNC